jgi:signal transduction histidine kinase
MAEPYSSEHDHYIERYEKTGEARAIGRIRTVTAKRKDDSLFPIELSITEIEVDDEVHYAAFIRDISEKTRLQEQLVESERFAAIGNTAAKIAHEIANPLNGIYLTLQLVEQRLGRRAADDQTLPNIVKIKREVGRLNQLVQEFRTLSRQQRYDFRSMQLPQLIDDIVDLQQSLCDSRGIVIKRSIGADLPRIVVDEDKVKQALLNLVKNAVEAMPQGGILAIAVSRRGVDSMLVEVSDTGVGIAPRTNVFAPFATTKKDGTGLGLLIGWQIVAAHGGTISYDSEPGKGTTFRIVLPLTPPIRQS